MISSGWARAVVLCLCAGASARAVTVSGESPVATPPNISSAGDPTLLQMAGNAARYLAVWADTRSGASEIYGARITAAGAVEDAYGIRIGTGTNPAVACDGTDFLVAWESADQIYAARVRGSDGAVVDSTPIGVATTALLERGPQVAFGGGQYFVAWAQKATADLYWVVRGKRVSQAGVVLDVSARTVSRSSGTATAPRVTSDGTNFLVAFISSPGTTSAAAALVDATGAVQGAGDVAVSTGTGIQAPLAAGWNGTNYLVVWSELQVDRDLYAARIDSAGNVVDLPPFAISTAASSQINPTLDCALAGSCYVAWRDSRSVPGYEIYGATVAQNGNVGPTKTLVTGTQSKNYPALALAGTQPAVVWRDSRQLDPDVYGQRLTSALNLNGAELLVSTAGGAQVNLRAAAGPAGQALVAWSQAGAAGYDVLAKRVDSGGAFVDAAPITVCNAADDQLVSAVAYDATNGNYVVLWEDSRTRATTNVDLYFARVRASDGLLLDANGVAAVATPAREDSGDIAAYGGWLLVAYSKDQFSIWAARIDGALGTPVSNDEVQFGDSAVSYYSPAVAGGGGTFYAFWTYDGLDDLGMNFITRLMGARIDPVTGAIGSRDRLVENGANPGPRATYAGIFFHVVHGISGHLEDFLLDAAGFTGGEVVLSGAYPSGPHRVATDGTNVVATWNEGYDVVGTRLSAGGVIQDPAQTLVSSSSWLSNGALAATAADQLVLGYSRFEAAPPYGNKGGFCRMLDYSGGVGDVTPPVIASVNDGTGADIDVQASTSTLDANWSGSDPESGIAGYQWAIGTTAGGQEVQPYAGVGVSTSASATGLSLVSGTQYYVTVRATNGVGLTATLSSDGVLVDGTAPVVAYVRDGTGADIDTQTSTSVIEANWSFSDAESGIAGYEWAIGTTGGGQEVQAFASVGVSTSASATGLSLVTGTRYYVTVRATNGVGLTTTSWSNGVVVDGTPPVMNYVNDGMAADIDAQSSTSTLSANWNATDPETAIVYYEWAIGTTAGGTEIQPFTPAATSATATGLSLVNGIRYYVTVRATNGAGLTSTMSSDGVVVDTTAPLIAYVNDGLVADIDVQASTSVIDANWSGSDAESGIAGYEWAIGTTAGGTNVQAYASVGTSTSASAVGLSLTTGTRYYVTVRATNGVGLTATMSSDGVVVDGTAPVIANVNDGAGADIDVQASTSVINANWSGSDAESGIGQYEWAIGTTAGGTNVRAYASVGTSTSASATGLSLVSGTRYYVTVRATNGVGLSATMSSDGVVVDGTAPVLASVNDGAGADIDVQASASVIDANWSGSDAESGIGGYEWAIGTTAGGQQVRAYASVGASTSASATGLSLVSGTRYYVTVRATNGVGLTSTLSSDGVVVDTSVPVIASVNDGAGADIDVQASTSVINANWSGSDPESGISQYEWAIGTTAGGQQVQAYASVGVATSASATGLSLVNGTRYYVTVRATNGVGLTSTLSSDGVVVDGTAPVIANVNDGAGADIDVQASASVLDANWSGSDAESGISQYEWAIGTTAGGQEVRAYASVGASTSASATGLSLVSGTRYYVTVRATNGVGLTSTLSSDGVVVDTSAPVIAYVNDGPGADIDLQGSTSVIDANWSGSDAESGISGYEWAIGTTAGGQQVQAYASVGVATSASATGLSLVNGTRYYVTVRATNGVGLTSTLSSDGVVVDTSVPIMEYVNDGSGADIDYQTSMSVISANWSGSDPGSGISGYEWAIGTTAGGQEVQAYASVGVATSASATGLSLVSGTRYYVTVRATNGLGFTSTLSSDGVVVDDTAPAIANVNDGTGVDIDVQASTSVINANWSGSDPESGIAGYEWAIGTTAGGQEVQAYASVGTSTSASATGLSLTTGTRYYVTVRATNGAGLATTLSSDGVVVDGTAPVIADVNDGPGADIDVQASASALDANWSGSDPESGISGYEWAIGTTAGGQEVRAYASVGTSASASAGGLSLTNGTRYYVTVRATNGVGLTSTFSSDGVVVDTTAPAIAYVNDGTGEDIDLQASTSVIDANWSGSDPESGIAGYEWAIGTTAGGQEVRAYASVGASTSASATGLSLVSGTRYYVTVRATNGVGLTSSLSSDGVVVNTTAPVITYVNDGPGADIDFQTSLSVIDANWSGSDPASGIAGYEWAIGTTAGGTEIQPFTSAGTSTSASATGLSLTSGMRYYVAVRATNGLGITFTAVSDGVTVDGSAPVIAGVNDGTGADIDVQASTSTLDANWSGSDAESGIASYEWAIGTTAGGTDVQPFVPVGTSTSASATGLVLQNAVDYYVTVRATNGAGLSSTATSDGVKVVLPLARLRVSGLPANALVGALYSVTVEALDGLDAVASGFSGTVTFTSSDALATLPADYFFLPIDAGAHVFTSEITFWTPGTHSVTASVAEVPSVSGEQAGIVVSQPDVPVILRNANLSAAVGVPYRYNATGRISAAGTAPISFDTCGAPADFRVEPTSGTVRWTPTVAGPTQVCVRAWNALGEDPYTFTVDVHASAPAAPVAVADVSPTSGPAALAATLDGSASTVDPSAQPAMHLWDPADGSPPVSGAWRTHTYFVPGIYRPRLEVYDAVGQGGVAEGNVEVLGAGGARPPSARIVASASTGADALDVTFSCDCTPGSSALIGYWWDFGDGTRTSEQAPTHQFGPGRFHVRLVVTDAGGLTASDEHEIAVAQDARPPPECDAYVTPPAQSAPVDATFEARAFSSAGSIASYGWTFRDGTTAGTAQVSRHYASPYEELATLTVQDDAGLACVDQVELHALSEGARAPRIVQAVLPAQARCGVALGASTLAASGDVPLAWSLAAGPDGFALDPATGAVSWTPTGAQVGIQSIAVEVQNGAGVDRRELSVEVTCEEEKALQVVCGCNSGPGGSALAAIVLLALARIGRRPRRD